MKKGYLAGVVLMLMMPLGECDGGTSAGGVPPAQAPAPAAAPAPGSAPAPAANAFSTEDYYAYMRGLGYPRPEEMDYWCRASAPGQNVFCIVKIDGVEYTVEKGPSGMYSYVGRKM